MRDLLNRKIAVREGGRARKITVFEAILLRFTEDALKGNTKSAAFIFNRYAGMQAGSPLNDDISHDDRAVLDAFVRQLEAHHKSKGEKLMTSKDQALLNAILRNNFGAFLSALLHDTQSQSDIFAKLAY